MDITTQLLAYTDEIAFVLGIGICSYFWQAYRKCCKELEREELLNRFLQP